MKNKTLAIFGISAYILSVISSAQDSAGNPVMPGVLIAIAAIATVAFVVMATIRLWESARALALTFVLSSVILSIVSLGEAFTSSYGSTTILFLNLVKVVAFISAILVVIRLFKIGNVDLRSQRDVKQHERELTYANYIPADIIEKSEKLVDSIKKGEGYTEQLLKLNREVANSINIGDVDSNIKADALTEGIKLAIETREIGGINTFLSTSLDDNVFVLGTSSKGFSRKFIEEYEEYEDVFFGRTIIERMMNRIAIKIRSIAVKSQRRTAINVLDNWTRLIKTSLIFINLADYTATQLALTPLAKSLGMDATAIFKDAVKIEPQTDLGKITRKEAQRELLEKTVA